MTFQKANLYLDSLAFHGMKLGLVNTTRLLNLLGDPHLSLKVIHVGGTNGKGSTCAVISSILTSAGISNGLYTSPHQESFRERIQVGGEMISEDAAADIIAKTRAAVQSEPNLPVTYFEFLTAAAFLHFAAEKVEVAVMEVGLGGRFDSTNVVEDPAVCVITEVAMDHMEHLGDTLEDIAMEKCGIIKKGHPVVIGMEEGTAGAKVAEETARRQGAKVYMAGREFSVDRNHMVPDGETLDYSTPAARMKNLKVGMYGRKQVDNAGLAITAAHILRDQGMEISDEAIRKGLERAPITGRFETVLEKPMVILDGAHNPDAAAALCATIMERFGPGRVDIVFGAMRDKDYKAMLAALAPAARSFVCYSPNVPRAEDPKALAGAQLETAIPTTVASGPDDVISLIRNSADDALIVITGSFYTVGEIRTAMRGSVGAAGER